MGSSPLPYIMLPVHPKSQIAKVLLRQIIRTKNLFMSMIFLAAFLLLPGFNNFGWGQTISQYQFSANNGTFTSISTSGTASVLAGADDSYQNNISIGFVFNYCGTNYSAVHASTNGWMALGGSALNNSIYINNLTGTANVILAPLWDDLKISNSGNIFYTTTGTTPNRIFTVEWYRERWNYSVGSNTTRVISFQVKLYETSNQIEFIYQQESTDVANGSATIGISDGNTGSGHFLSLDGTGNNPAASSVTETTTLNTRPATGQVYKFVPFCSVGGTISGGTSPLCLGTGTGTMTLTGNVGTIVRWELQVNSGGWNDHWNGGNNTLSETPSNTGTLEYRAVVKNGTCPIDYSTTNTILVNANTVAGWISGSSTPICEGGNTGTITLNGSTGSIVRWEKRVNSGSWIVIPNTLTTYSETPSSSGTWEYRALVQSGSCTSLYSTSFSMTVNPILTITLGTNPTICRGTSVAPLSYSATTGTPTALNIDFDAAANSAGIGDISGWGLSTSPISINVPWNVPVGVYNGILSVATTYPVCTSVGYPITITVNEAPILTGLTTATAAACTGSSAKVTLGATSLPNGTYTANYTLTGANSQVATNATMTVAGGNIGTFFTTTLANPGSTTITINSLSSGTCTTNATTGNTSGFTVTNLPAATISYSGNPLCKTSPLASVTLTGTAGGGYSSSPAGLTIDPVTGSISANTSTAGNYTVTYFMAATGGCVAQTATTSVTILPTNCLNRVFYSLKSGSWDDPAVWTLDPSGSLPLNPGNLTPTTSSTSAYDEVVVLSGRTVTITTNNKVNNSLTVIGTLNFGATTGNSFTTINGTGRIRLSGDNFPSGDASNFVTTGQGEGTVEYYGTTRSLTTARTFFNVEINMNAANILSLLADYTLNGSLTVSNGAFQINDNTSTIPKNITVNGDIKITATGKITTGKANARHQLNIYGNFTNSGEVWFTNRIAANYAAEATDGIVDANFLNTEASQSIFCRGITNFYRIEINKGTDNTFTLNLDATDPANFNLFGYANENHAAVAQLANNNNALGLISGTVRIGNSIVIPTLSTANNYNISEDAQLWLNGGTVQKNSGLTIAVYGKIRITTGLLEAKIASGITLANNGTFNVDGGIANINQLRTSDLGAGPNNGGYIQTGGTVNVLGGTTNTDYYVFSLPSTASVFNMSGGILKVNTSTGNGAILINSDPENIKVTGGTVIAETAAADNFIITSSSPFWNLEFRNSSAASRQFMLAAASNIGPSDINAAAQPLKILNDFRIWGQESGGLAYPQIIFNPALTDIYIGGSFFVEKGSQYAPVSGGATPYNATANQPTSRNTTYFNKTAGTDAVEVFYVGETASPLELGKLVVDRTAGYEVKVTSGSARINESVAIDVNGDASVLSGILNQNLYTIRTWGAIVNNGRMGTWYPGVTPSHAQIQMVENPSLTLTAGIGSIFGNVQVNVTPPAKITLANDIYIERMEYVKGLIYLKGFNLKVDYMWNLETGLFENFTSNSYLKVADNGYSASSMIFTDGKASDAGLSIKVIANSLSENQNNIINNFGPVTFPVGFTPNGGSTLYFRPAQVVVKNFSDDGYITIRPVLGSLQTTNQTGGTEVLQHYWRVSSSDFTTLPTVAYRFYYRNQKGVANVDLVTAAANEASYVPGKVLDESPYTRLYEPLAENDVIKAFGTGGNSRFITINGTSTNGLFSPSSAGITLENANYTTGVSARFAGSVLIYYTRDYQQEAMWNNTNSWTRSDKLNTLYAPHDSRQPAAGAIPGSGDVAVIGWIPWTDTNRTAAQRGQPHSIWVTDTRSVAEVVFTKMTDTDGNPVPRAYRSNFQFRPTLTINANGDYDALNGTDNGILTAKMVKGEGLFWNRDSDPDFTKMDIGDFARQDSSYVIYENFTSGRIINNTPVLFPNIYISNDGWGANDKDFTFAKDINTTGNVELLGNVNLILPTGATGNITAGRNLVMFENAQSNGGGAEIDYGNSGIARKVVVKGDLVMKNTNSIIQVRNPNSTAPLVDHELHVEGNIIQGTSTISANGLDLWSAANNDRITLYLEGNISMTYNRVNGTIPDLYRIVVNKGISQLTTAQFNTDFVLNGSTSGVGIAKALELKNGTFIYNNTNATRILTLTSGNDFFDIPSSAGLNILQGTARANGNSGITLDGNLTISGGTLDMTTGTGENPIEYSASGNATISVSSGNLNVGGQIRRSLTSDAGILQYSQTGGNVVVGQNAATANNRGVFEILNPGSSFNMTAGDLYIVRAQTTPTVSAFYFNPETYNIGATANINIGHSSTPSNQTIGIYAGKPLPKLRVNNQSNNNPIAKLEVVPATITSLLQIDTNASFNANGIDLLLNGDMTSLGTFISGGNTTYLSGVIPQTITGNGSSLNFYNLDKTLNNNVILNGANTPLLISNELLLRSGTLTTNSNTVTVKGNVLNDAIQIYGGTGDGILLDGIVTQTLTGNGTFGKLTINNPNGIEVPVANQFKITNSLKMQSGVLNIGKNLLDFGVNAVIEQASPFSNTNMITTNISFTDNGVRKTFPAGTQSDFIFPVGSADKYTPVTLSITANGNSTGSITVRPANEIHPSIIEDSETGTQIVDKDNALQYYWTLKANGITDFSGTATMRYIDTDIKVTAPYTVADYFTASLMADGLGNWLKFPKTDFDEANKNMIFSFSSKDDNGISGDYTAGAGDASLNGAIPDKVSKYETNTNGTWNTGSIWTPNVPGGPRGAIAKINEPHTVVVTADYLAEYMTEVYGILKLNSTVGHRLGIVNGNGTIYSELGDLPAAVYDNFFSSAGGTLEFGGSSKSYEFLGNIFEINHLKLTGSGERRFPNNNLTLNGNLIFSGDAGLNAINYYNKKLSVKGNITRTNGTYTAGTGANATIALVGTLPQSISGSFSNSNALNNLEINNINDIIIINDVEINRELKLTNGLINTSASSIFRINYGAFVTPVAGSALSFVNGTLTKEMITGNSFTFPIGNYSFTKAHGPITLQNVTGPAGLNDWNATYFYANPDAVGSTSNFASPIATVSQSEYWKIQAPTGGQSIISITLDGSSDVGSTIPDLNNLRIVGWNTTISKWEVVGTGANISGTNVNGTITTTSPVNFGSYTFFTIASVTPLSVSSASFTSPSVVNLCNGSSTTMVVAFSGSAPWTLTYKAGTTPITITGIATSPYRITVTPSATTVYTLTGITANGIVGTINGTASVTVNVSQIPTVVLSSNDADNTICQGTSITFTATAGLPNYQFRVNGITVQNGAGNTYTTSTLTTGVQSIDVIGTNTNACSSTSSAIAVTVNPFPAAAGAITGAASVCKASSATYTVPAIANATDYIWTASNGATGTSNTNSITLTFPNSGSSTITVKGRNACGNGTSSTFSVTVNTASTPGAAGAISGPVEICKGATGYTYSVSAIANATSYTWSYSGTGATINGSGNSITVDFGVGTTNGSLTVAGTNGCSTGVVSVNFGITALNPPTATITPASPTICSGSTLAITANPAGGSLVYNNNLWTGDGATSLSNTGIANPSFTNTTGGTYNLNYIVTDSKGCKGTASTSVIVFQAPVAEAGPNSDVCTGLLPIALTGATAAGSYSGYPTWSGTGGIWTQNPDPALATFTPSSTFGTTTATLTLTGANGCSNVSDTRTITWNKKPDQPGVISGTTAQCSGLTGQIYSITAVPNATTYAWTVPTGWAITAGGGTTSITVTTGAAGQNGNITVTAGNGCGASAASNLTVTVNPGTPAIPGAITGTTAQCPALTNQAYGITAVTNASVYTWTVPTGWTITAGGGTTSITVKTGTAGQNGNITVTAGNGCGTSAASSQAVTVNPNASIGSITGSSSLCIKGTTTYTANSVVLSGGTGTWSSSNPAIVTVTPATDGTIVTGVTAGTCDIIYTITGGCGGTVFAKQSVTIIGDQVWTGTVSSNWNDSGNWSCGFIPDLTTNVLIPIIPNVANYPVIGSGAIGTVKDITIATGSSLTVTGNTLQIAGAITNSGTFTALAGTIDMEGTASQIIGASVFDGNTIGNLIINNSAGVSLSGALNVTGIVLVQTGNLNSSGFLTLLSNKDQTALIDGSGSGEVKGNVTMQRYLPKAFGYKYFSSPFQHATVNEFADDINLAATFPTFYRYDENHIVDGKDVSGWTVYTATTGEIKPLEGYAANFGPVVRTHTTDMVGEVNNHGISINLKNNNKTYTQGFNLIGNPYPSPIDWNATNGITTTNIDKGIYFFRACDLGVDAIANDTLQYQGSYTSYVNGIPTGDENNIIASMQGFFIHVTDPIDANPVSATLTLTNSVRRNELNPLFKAAILDDRTILRFAANFETKNPIEDVAVIYFDDLASRSFDKDKDALKMLNTYVLIPNLYTLSTDIKQLSINGMPSPSDSITTIPLGITTIKDGWISFKAKDISKLPSNIHIYLIDAIGNVTQDLKLNPTYRFYLKTGEYNQRFTLVFSLSDITKPVEVFEKMFTLTRSGDHLYAKVNLPLNTKGDLFVTNMQGQTLLRKGVFEMETVEINPNSGSGVYIVTMVSGKRTQSEKILIRKDYE